MFDDKRSRQVILLAHCILNQNAKIDRCAHYPGCLPEVAAELISSGVGLIQLPCPELLYLGLDRQAAGDRLPSVEAEDSRVAGRLSDEGGRALCRELARGLAYQLEEYRHHGFQVLGLLGINGSPTCGVETAWSIDGAAPGPGLFIRLLLEECRRTELPLALRGLKASEPAQAVAAVRALLANTPP